VLVRIGQEVQEVPRQLNGRANLTWKRRLGDLALLGLAFAVGSAAVVGYTSYRIWEVGGHDTRRHADAIVVLGAAQYNGRPSPVLAARLDHAIELFRDGDAPWFVVTGGKLPGDRTTEAATERAYAVANGVPAAAILGESTGGTTLESMKNVRELFTAHGLNSAVFVSDRSHMLRVLRLAQDQDIEAWASPTETSPDDLDPNLRWDSMLHELGAFALYFLVDRPEDASGPASTSATGAAQPFAPAAG
jgi:uncharacterized SAM-binding protein YcdF (DUF218 family)